MQGRDEPHGTEVAGARAPGTEHAEVAREVRALLAAAEEAAAAIRQEAETDASEASLGRSRLRSAAFDLGRLSAQAEALSHQADALRGQGDAIRDRLATELDGDAPEATQWPGPSAGEHSDQETRQASRRRAGGARLADPFPRSSARMEAHRMKLAGARRNEVRAFLERRAAAEVDALVTELFGGYGTDEAERE